MSKVDEKNWKTNLIAKWQKYAGACGNPDDALKALQVVDYLLTHDLGEKSICHKCGMEQKAHKTHCPYHE